MPNISPEDAEAARRSSAYFYDRKGYNEKYGQEQMQPFRWRRIPELLASGLGLVVLAAVLLVVAVIIVMAFGAAT